MCEVDPEGVEARCRRVLKRQEYSIPCPLFLWHVDGNHKLIRYRIRIHIGKDGQSRNFVFVDANDNNRSTTVESLLLPAVETYGYPINVRIDLGGENVLVLRHMNLPWGTEQDLWLLAAHNQRVEQFSRNFNVNIAQVVCPKLKELVDTGLLHVNKTDMFCLHYVLLPCVKKLVKEFAFAHNNHPLCTESNLTPIQLLHFIFHLTQLHWSMMSSIPGTSVTQSFTNVSSHWWRVSGLTTNIWPIVIHNIEGTLQLVGRVIIEHKL